LIGEQHGLSGLSLLRRAMLGRSVLESSPERQETAMQRWMSRSAPRAKFTANDWLVENSNSLVWTAIVIVGFLLAGLIIYSRVS
jgi:hypothetical protein